MRVTLATRVDAGLYRGGAEIAVEKLREALQARGHETEVLTPHTQRLGDVVHLHGEHRSHWGVVHAALRDGVKVVWSPVFSSDRGAFGERVRGVRHRLTGRFPREFAKVYRHADALVAATPRERERILAYFGKADKPFEVVPNGVDRRFASGDPSLLRERLGLEGEFVLQVGAFSRTKNQLGVWLALKDTGLPVVMIGRVFEPEVLERLRSQATPRLHLVTDVAPGDPLLASAYAAASVFCAPSLNETFLMAGVEAAVGGCRLVLSDAWNAEEVFGPWASLANPRDPSALKAAVLDALKKGRPGPEQRDHFLATYSWERAAEQCEALYARLLMG